MVAVDTFIVGMLKGVDKIYLQSAIDCHPRYAFALLYPNKLDTSKNLWANQDLIDSIGRVAEERRHGRSIPGTF